MTLTNNRWTGWMDECMYNNENDSNKPPKKRNTPRKVSERKRDNNSDPLKFI